MFFLLLHTHCGVMSYLLLGENTLNPLKIVVISIIFLQSIILVMYGHHILDLFVFKKYIWLNLELI
jgi:hypothetical protein